MCALCASVLNEILRNRNMVTHSVDLDPVLGIVSYKRPWAAFWRTFIDVSLCSLWIRWLKHFKRSLFSAWHRISIPCIQEAVRQFSKQQFRWKSDTVNMCNECEVHETWKEIHIDAERWTKNNICLRIIIVIKMQAGHSIAFKVNPSSSSIFDLALSSIWAV